LRSARTRGPITFGHPTSRTALSARPSVDAVLMPGRLAERGVAIPGPGDYVRVWMSRELKRSGKLSYMDTLSTELAGSTTPAAVILFVACRLRRRWSELGGWYAEMADTRFHPLDCACWN